MYPYFNSNVFKERLVETISWCNQQTKISTEVSTIRTLASEPDNIEDLHDDRDLLEVFATQIYNGRKKRLGHSIYQPDQAKIDLQKGILIVFFASHANAVDGIAKRVSKGFFNRNGFPAWDTWVYHVSTKEKSGILWSNHIFSWVPPQFVPDVRAGIAENWDEAIVEMEKGKHFYDYFKLIDDLVEY